jgi:hypothetical protein
MEEDLGGHVAEAAGLARHQVPLVKIDLRIHI